MPDSDMQVRPSLGLAELAAGFLLRRRGRFMDFS
jgi:hypothetical protein